MNPLRVFIGWDPREQAAYDVAAHTLRKHSSIALAISVLSQPNLRQRNLYTRPVDEPASTDFAHTRFLVPFLRGYTGFALFFDCDFMWTQDVAKLFDAAIKAGKDKAVWVVKHDYKPKARWKMDGQPQVAYPRKNWSSLMIFNCAHPSTQNLTLNCVNNAPAAFLHQFAWCKDDEIGELPLEWNWLEGEYDWDKPEPPAVIHMTNGGPWFDGCQGVRFADLWRAEHLEAQTEKKRRERK